jgi:hypothetical protein
MWFDASCLVLSVLGTVGSFDVCLFRVGSCGVSREGGGAGGGGDPVL